MMYGVVPLLLKGSETYKVPAGDPGEQVIANLILTLIAVELRADTNARAYLGQAHALAFALAARSVIYRPPQASIFARLTCELEGHTESILLSVINGTLVIPPIVIGPAGDDQRRQPVAANVVDLDVPRFMLRLRTRRLVSVLNSLKDAPFKDRKPEAVSRILQACMHQELPPADPLDRANDFFALAHDLIGNRNRPLAALALKNAGRELNRYEQMATIGQHPEIVRSMQEQIAKLLSELVQTAM